MIDANEHGTTVFHAFIMRLLHKLSLRESGGLRDKYAMHWFVASQTAGKKNRSEVTLQVAVQNLEKSALRFSRNA